ncbi:hypothetical protein Tco_0079844 [Tanacetum coccineum]
MLDARILWPVGSSCFVNTMATRVRDTKRRTMAAVEVVNLRVSYQADVRRRESLGFYSRHQEAQEGLARPEPTAEALEAKELSVLRLRRLEDVGEAVGLLKEHCHNPGTGARRNERATRECTYPEFMKCQPLNFKGTEGVVELTQWIKKIEIWNSHVRIVGNDIAYAMTWTELKKKITDKYCLRTEIKKLKVELWELKVKESDNIEKYVGGLPDMIHESVVASKPKTMQEATEMAIEVMDKRIYTFADH